MYCPRCGSPNEVGDRFCSACGATLRATETGERRSLPEHIGRLIGTTRKARLISAATAITLAIAVAAFIALKPSDDAIPRDAYTIAADRICLASKQEIVTVERRYRNRPEGDPSAFARALVPIVATWRSQLLELTVPTDRLEEAKQLETALRDAEIRVAELARIAAQGNKGETLASAKQADAASASVEEAVSSLGLSQCASATIGFSPDSS